MTVWRKAIWLGVALVSLGGVAFAVGMDRLRVVAAREVLRLLISSPELSYSDELQNELDQVAQMKDARFSGLIFHKSLSEAMAVAQREHKPIISLRLLGRLTDELSCANSRFFRMAVYPDKRVRQLLADNFVLHWESVRPVPVITIDFGNGSRIRQTITGNSLHLVLDSLGRPVDVLPGLYGPGSFAKELLRVEEVAKQAGTLALDEFSDLLQQYHTTRRSELETQFAADCVTAGLDAGLHVGTDIGTPQWKKVAALYAADVTPDENTRVVMTIKETNWKPQRRSPRAEESAIGAVNKSYAFDSGVLPKLFNVTETFGEDTVRNEFHLHAQIHQWFSENPLLATNELIEKVYRDLFLSPLDDPWYGLSQPDRFSALPNSGRIVPKN